MHLPGPGKVYGVFVCLFEMETNKCDEGTKETENLNKSDNLHRKERLFNHSSSKKAATNTLKRAFEARNGGKFENIGGACSF